MCIIRNMNVLAIDLKKSKSCERRTKLLKPTHCIGEIISQRWNTNRKENTNGKATKIEKWMM